MKAQKLLLALVFNAGSLSLNAYIHGGWQIMLASVLVCALSILPILHIYHQRANANMRCWYLIGLQNLNDEEFVELIKLIEGGLLLVNNLQAAMDAIALNVNAWKPDSEDKQDCAYNAHSPYLRCAVNPAGTCASCQYYQCNDVGIRAN